MTAPYEPELGQMLFGNPTSEYEVPDYVEAFLAHVLREIDRVYWNTHQGRWDEGGEFTEWPFLQYRPYWWGDCDCEEGHPPDCPSVLPNLAFGGVEVRWYKHFGRGMSTNTRQSEVEWRKWLDRCLEAIRQMDVDVLRRGSTG